MKYMLFSYNYIGFYIFIPAVISGSSVCKIPSTHYLSNRHLKYIYDIPDLLILQN